MRLFSFLLFFAYATPSFALTPAEVKRSYEACMSFLKMPLAKQKQVAKKSGYPLSDVLWACHLQARHSLSYMQQQEREYQRQQRNGGYSGGSGGGAENDPYGGSGGGFGGPGVCTNGVCNGPGGTTVCTNGVCNGPGGTTVCTNGVCN